MATLVRFQSNDGADITIGLKAANRSKLFRALREDEPDEPILDFPVNANGEVLRKVVEWCEHHQNEEDLSLEAMELDSARSRRTAGPIELDEWDMSYFQVDQEMLFELILAAYHMEIQCLMSAGCKTVANMIRGKSPEEIRKTFNITNDFTPEEEEQIRRENEWAEDRDWDEPTASFYLDNTETTGQRKLSIVRRGTGISVDNHLQQQHHRPWHERLIRFTSRSYRAYSAFRGK